MVWFPPLLVTCFPSSCEKEQCLEKVRNMTKESSHGDAQCATTHTTVCTSYVAAVVPSYILLGSLARVARKLPNWSGFPPYLLLFSPVLGSRNSVIILNCHAYFPFSGFNGVSSALMINNKNSWLNSERASKSVWSCLILFGTALPRWLESFQICLVSPSTFPGSREQEHFLEKSWIWQI